MTCAELVVECDGWCGKRERVDMARTAYGHEGYEPTHDPSLRLYPLGMYEYCADCLPRAELERDKRQKRYAAQKARREAQRAAGE